MVATRRPGRRYRPAAQPAIASAAVERRTGRPREDVRSGIRAVVALHLGDPRRGVTDGWGRGHGLPNFHIPGSSLFPTGGWANPTLTILALTLRTADRISDELRSARPGLIGQDAAGSNGQVGRLES